MRHILFVIPLLALLTSCMTENTRMQISESQAKAETCWERAVEYQHAALNNAPKVTTEVGALFYLMLVQQNSDKLFSTCDDMTIALLNSHNQRYMANLRATTTLGGIAIGAYALDSIASTMASNMGSSSTTQITGSRVVSGSGNGSRGSTISASGEGLGQANQFLDGGDDVQGVAGYQPRTNPVQTDSINDNQPQSASGENQGGNPVEVGDDGATIQPFVAE